jgi:hypothetical protein
LHGLPRMTKDIDLLLPVNVENNERLIRALQALPENKNGIEGLRLEWMNKGHSTVLEGEITIDLLYVAASQSFDTLAEHIKTVMFAGTQVVTLDIDGMILSKATPRASDLEDRLKLGRLKIALRSGPRLRSKFPGPDRQRSKWTLHLLHLPRSVRVVYSAPCRANDPGVEHVIGRAAHAPTCVGQPFVKVQHLLVGLLESIVQKAKQLVMKCGRVSARMFIERLKTADPNRSHEASEVGVLHHTPVGPPNGT